MEARLQSGFYHHKLEAITGVGVHTFYAPQKEPVVLPRVSVSVNVIPELLQIQLP